MNRQLVEYWVESLCRKGCRAVWRDIARLECGERMADMEALTDEECSAVLEELKAIMAVYGETGCSAGTPVKPAASFHR